MAISSGPLGGGIGRRQWIINATVPMSYDRDDPDAHLAEIAAGLSLDGPGVGLLTGVDVARMCRAADGGVTAWATVGLGAPVRAAGPDEFVLRDRIPAPAAAPDLVPGRSATPAVRVGTHASPDQTGANGAIPAVRVGTRAAQDETGANGANPAFRVGTINIVALVPANLSGAALVNAVATATEAKAQALAELGVAGTGTATDAVCVLSATGGPVEPYGGPRSRWGSRLARAVHRAVLSGGAADLADGVPWSVANPVDDPAA